MNKHADKYGGLVKELISRSFPGLKDEKIKIKESPSWLDLSFVAFGIKNSYIFVNKSLRKENSKGVRGTLVHELCHIETDKKSIKIWGFFRWVLINLSWLFNTKMSRQIERTADIDTIKKGYGKELLYHALKREKKYSKKRLTKVYSRGYLSPKQIKQEMKKLK